MNTIWSTFVQNPTFLKFSRMQIMNRDMSGEVLSRLNIKPGMKVLDVGTGTGEFIRYMAENTKDVSYTGVDLDPVLLRTAEADTFFSDPDNSYEFIEGDACALPFDDGGFDIVVSHTFLTACWYYEQALDEMRRVCRKDGLIGTLNISDFTCVSSSEGKLLPDMGDWYFEFCQYRKRFNTAREKEFPMSNFNLGIDPRKVPETLSLKGFEDISVMPVGSFFSLSNNTISTEDKETYIRLSTQAEEERVDHFLRACPENGSFTEEDGKAYISLLHRMNGYLLGHIGDDTRWEHQAYTYLLVTAKPGSDPLKKDSEYLRTKYKAVDPISTISRIKGILSTLNIETTEQMISSGIDGVYSCRISIRGTSIGQNGKGTTPFYALASGYAEFMERLSTGYLFQADLPEQYHQKDAVMISYEEIEEKCGNILTMSKKGVEGVLSLFLSDVSFMRKWDFASRSGCFEAFPFRRLSDGKTEYLPDCIYRNYYYTNGSCAGNTREEALTQGLSEIFERYAFMQILKEDMTPPEIPEAELRAIPVVWDIICQIRSHTDLRLKIFDASLGIGLPVIGAILLDKSSKKGRFKLGSHPRIESALERVLTEMLQGTSISDISRISSVVSMENERFNHTERNLFNMAKSSSGTFSYRSMLGSPSWEYTGFRSAPETSEGQYEYLLDLCRSLDWEVYVRDCSFYGFPVYHVIIPPVSMIFDFGSTPYLSARYRKKYKDVLLDPAAHSEEEQAEALKTLKLMRGWIMQDSLNWNAGVPVNCSLFGIPLNYDLVKLLMDISHKAYDNAIEILRMYRAHDGFDVLLEFCTGAGQGIPITEITDFLSLLYGADKIRMAERIFTDPLSFLPGVHCYQCRGCSLEKKCSVPILEPIWKAMYITHETAF